DGCPCPLLRLEVLQPVPGAHLAHTGRPIDSDDRGLTPSRPINFAYHYIRVRLRTGDFPGALWDERGRCFRDERVGDYPRGLAPRARDFRHGRVFGLSRELVE